MAKTYLLRCKTLIAPRALTALKTLTSLRALTALKTLTVLRALETLTALRARTADHEGHRFLRLEQDLAKTYLFACQNNNFLYITGGRRLEYRIWRKPTF